MLKVDHLNFTDPHTREFVRLIPAAVAVVDKDMRYLAVSNQWLRDYRLEEDDIIGLSHYEVFPEIPDHWKRLHQRGLAGENLKKSEDSFVRADGRTEWLRWEVVPWRHLNNTVGGLIMYTEVITDGKEAALRLIEEKNRAEQYLSVSGTMILTLNSAGRVMNINESGRRILDCESSEVLGRDWFYTFVPIDLQAAAWASFHSDMEHPFDGIRQFESPVVTRQGGTRMISWRAVIPRNSEGVPTSMLYSGDDITEKRDAERNFRELSFRNETILNSAGDGLYGIDRNGLTTFINPAGAEMVGYKPEYLIGQPIHNLIHHTDQNGSPYPASASPILRAARGGDSQKKSNEVFWRSDESSFPVEYTATPILGENGPSGAVVVFRDVTEQRDLQAKLIQSSKLATLGEMATGVAHELNQPMNIIGMAAASITRKLDKGGIDEEYTRKKLDKIIAQTRRAAEIIDHMRIFGRPAINDPVALHVPDIAKSALDLVSEQLRLASIDVTFEPLDSCGAVLA